MNDFDFWLQIRRATIAIARAICKRYGWTGLVVLLTGKEHTGKE